MMKRCCYTLIELAQRSAGSIVLAVSLVLAAQPAPAQRLETTGSHLGRTIPGRIVTRFGTPGEIADIQALLDAGRTEAAVSLAEDYLDSLDGVVYTDATAGAQERYLALNALCVALTRSERPDDAIAACTKAMELNPHRWTAINNRGTAELAAGRRERALADYRRALELASDDGAVALIESNIALASRDE